MAGALPCGQSGAVVPARCTGTTHDASTNGAAADRGTTPLATRPCGASGHSSAAVTGRTRPVLLGAHTIALFFRRLPGDSRITACAIQHSHSGHGFSGRAATAELSVSGLHRSHFRAARHEVGRLLESSVRHALATDLPSP